MRVFGKRVSSKPASPRRPTASIHPLAALCGGRVLGSAERSEPTCIKTSTLHGAKVSEILKNIEEFLFLCYNIRTSIAFFPTAMQVKSI